MPRRPSPPADRLVASHRPAFEPLEVRRLMAAPELSNLADLDPPAGKWVSVPIATTYDGSDRLRYAVSSNDGGITAEFRPGTNTWLRMETTLGTMDFQLYDDLTPDTVRRMTGLAKAGFFDGLTFHRVIAGFVAQGGDPNGDGTGGPAFSFDDEFNAKTLFTSPGVLAMANSGKDTNGSQFFVTQGAPRSLDFNHTVWGQLVRGFAVRDRIIAADGPDQDQAPDRRVVINRMSVIENRTDAVLFVRADRASTVGTVTVTVTGNGGSDTQTFAVDGAADTGQQGPTNTPPFMIPPTNRVMPKNGELRFDVASVDVDSTDALRAVDVAAELEDLEQGTVRTEGSTVIFTPKQDLTGPVRMLVGVRQSGAINRGSTQGQPYDTQLITIGVGDRSARAAGIANLSAAAGTDTPAMVVATFTDLDPAGTAANWSAGIDWGDGTVSDGVVSRNADGTFSVTGDHEYPRAADDYPVTVTLTGNRGAVAIVNGTVDARDIASVTSRGTLVVNGSSGNDTITIDRASDGRVRATVNGAAKLFGLSRFRRLQINGYEGNDTLTVAGGVPRAATIDAGAGNDVVNGGDGADLLLGGGGRDRLSGNGGNDTLVGGAGTDVLDGGPGDNELVQ